MTQRENPEPVGNTSMCTLRYVYVPDASVTIGSAETQRNTLMLRRGTGNDLYCYSSTHACRRWPMYKTRSATALCINLNSTSRSELQKRE